MTTWIDVPTNSDFSIHNLPYGIFMRDDKPTPGAAMLNSLQMGFKTLAIQKRSSEVWQILGAVKTEFGKFGGVLEKAQRKLNEANKELESLVGTRTKMMLSKLKKVETLPAADIEKLLPAEEDTAEDTFLNG